MNSASGLACFHQRLVHLVGAQLVVAAFTGVDWLSCMDTHVSVDDEVRARYGLGRVAFDLDGRALGSGLVEKDTLGVEGRRAGKGEVEAELPCRMGEAGEDVVAVAAPGDLLARDRAAVFLEGENIGHDLAGMGAVRQPV